MPDRHTPQQRSYNMSKIRSQDTKPEKVLRSALHRHGLRFRKNLKGIPGTPDIAFTKRKVAVFIDGDFWHGRNLDQMLETGRFGDRKDYWELKLRRNIYRDQKTNADLAELGWTVLRVWESEIKADLDSVVRQVASLVSLDRVK